MPHLRPLRMSRRTIGALLAAGAGLALLAGALLARSPQATVPALLSQATEVFSNATPLAAPSAPPLAGARSGHFTLVGSVAGVATTVAVSDTIAYLGEGSGLTLFDVHDPRAPIRLGRSPLSGLVTDIQIVGHLAYIAESTHKLQILDLRNPTAPVILGEIGTPGTLSQARNMRVVGSIAYIAQYDGDLLIIDVHDPSHPLILSSFPLPQRGLITVVAATDTLAYLGTEVTGELHSGMFILDVHDPTKPTLRNQYIPSEDVVAVEAVGTRAYIVDRANMRILDMADPTAPVLLGTYPVRGAQSVQVIGTTAYVTSNEGTGYILDVRDPAAPRLLGRFDGPESPTMHVSGSRAYIVSGDHGLQIYDLSNPAAVVLLSGSRIWSIAEGVQVVGTIAYVAAGEEGLQILDIRDPIHAIALGGYDMPGYARSVRVVGTTAYLANSYDSNGVWIFDVSTPAQPKLLSTFATSDQVLDLQVIGDRLYIGGMLQIIDVSSPAHPTTLLTHAPLHYEGEPALAVVGERVYIAGRGLQILDIHDLRTPTLIGTYQTYRPSGEVVDVSDVEVVGSLAYIATASGMEIIDVRDAAHPTVLGRYPIGSGVVQVVGTVAYLAAEGGVCAIDVHDPAAPALIARYPTVSAVDIEVVDDRLYVAANGGGLEILAFSDEPLPTPAVAATQTP